MRLLHKERYTERQLAEFRQHILANTITAMVTMLEATDKLGVVVGDEGGAASAKARLLDNKSLRTIAASDQVVAVFASIARDLQLLWKTPEIQTVLRRSNEYDLDEAGPLYILLHLTVSPACSFLSHVERLSHKEYVPTEEDVMRVRVKTSGINETIFHVGANGGQMFRCVFSLAQPSPTPRTVCLMWEGSDPNGKSGLTASKMSPRSSSWWPSARTTKPSQRTRPWYVWLLCVEGMTSGRTA